MIKLFSLLITTTPILIFGFYYSYKDMYRQSDLRELYKAFNILKNEIDYSFKTLSQSFSSISNKVNYPMSEIFFDLSENIESDSDMTFDELFICSIRNNISKTYLNKRDINELLDLSKTINHLDNTAIISSINIFLTYLENELELLENSKNTNKKTYQSLTILSSILLSIILL